MIDEPQLIEASLTEDRSIDQTIGHLLRLGMYLAATVILTGGIMFLYAHAKERPDYHKFQQLPASLRSPVAIVRTAFRGDPMSVMQLGMILLIATPIGRVVFSVVAFAVRKDRLYVVISTIVLCVLLYSLFAH
jgi:uncharacterized membrane protein